MFLSRVLLRLHCRIVNAIAALLEANFPFLIVDSPSKIPFCSSLVDFSSSWLHFATLIRHHNVALPCRNDPCNYLSMVQSSIRLFRPVARCFVVFGMRVCAAKVSSVDAVVMSLHTTIKSRT